MPNPISGNYCVTGDSVGINSGVNTLSVDISSISIVNRQSWQSSWMAVNIRSKMPMTTNELHN